MGAADGPTSFALAEPHADGAAIRLRLLQAIFREASFERGPLAFAFANLWSLTHVKTDLWRSLSRLGTAESFQ